MKKLILLTFVTAGLVTLMILWPTLTCGVSEPSPVQAVTYDNLAVNWRVFQGNVNYGETGTLIFDYDSVVELGRQYDCTLYLNQMAGTTSVIPCKWYLTGSKNMQLHVKAVDTITWSANINFIAGATMLMKGTSVQGTESTEIYLIREHSIPID